MRLGVGSDIGHGSTVDGRRLDKQDISFRLLAKLKIVRNDFRSLFAEKWLCLNDNFVNWLFNYPEYNARASCASLMRAFYFYTASGEPWLINQFNSFYLKICCLLCLSLPDARTILWWKFVALHLCLLFSPNSCPMSAGLGHTKHIPSEYIIVKWFLAKTSFCVSHATIRTQTDTCLYCARRRRRHCCRCCCSSFHAQIK